MSVGTVASKDVRGVTRSRALWAVATGLALLAAAIALTYVGYQEGPAEMVRQLFRRLATALSILLPIVALVGSYMAIAGERESGGIVFLLGLPNSRRDVFLGKLCSRMGVAAAGVTFMIAAAASVGAARFGAFPAQVVFGLLGASVAYAWVFVAVAVALSAAVAAKTRAIAASVGAYFVLVLLYLVPGVRIPAIVEWFHRSVLGMSANPDLYDAVAYTSPLIAYRKATNLVFPPSMEQEVFTRMPPEGTETAPELPFYLADWVAPLVFAGWILVPLVVGYYRFQRADLE